MKPPITYSDDLHCRLTVAELDSRVKAYVKSTGIVRPVFVHQASAEELGDLPTAKQTKQGFIRWRVDILPLASCKHVYSISELGLRGI